MRKSKGFTLIELLIVVAIIAVLAAIAIPNFLEARVRAMVSSARGDMRTVATAVEAYCVDESQYPACRSLPDLSSINMGINPGSQIEYRSTFGSLQTSVPGERFRTLTTPTPYIVELPKDPFASTRGCNYGYYNGDDRGWLIWSYGPDADEIFGSAIDWETRGLWAVDDMPADRWAALCYNPFTANPTMRLIVETCDSPRANGGIGSAFTYDSTNGAVSEGDLWRLPSVSGI